MSLASLPRPIPPWTHPSLCNCSPQPESTLFSRSVMAILGTICSPGSTLEAHALLWQCYPLPGPPPLHLPYPWMNAQETLKGRGWERNEPLLSTIMCSALCPHSTGKEWVEACIRVLDSDVAGIKHLSSLMSIQIDSFSTRPTLTAISTVPSPARPSLSPSSCSSFFHPLSNLLRIFLCIISICLSVSVNSKGQGLTPLWFSEASLTP